MPRYVAFLRAINVGGHVVTMDRLRREFESLALDGVETFIASGNVIFSSRGAAAALEKRIEAKLAAALGYEVATMLRTDSEVAALAALRPFPEAAMKKAAGLYVAFLERAPGKSAERTIAGLRNDIDDLHLEGRELFWLCRARSSDSKFSNAVLEKALGLKSTMRNVNTLQRLAAKYPPAARR